MIKTVKNYKLFMLFLFIVIVVLLFIFIKQISYKREETVILVKNDTYFIEAQNCKEYYYENVTNNILSIDKNGKIFALNEGTGLILLKNGNGEVCKLYNIIVNEKEEKEVIVLGTTAETSVSLKKNEIKKIKYSVTPSEYNNDLIWTSKDEKIASVTNKGVVKGVNAGKTTIYMSSGNKTLKMIEVEVTGEESISINSELVNKNTFDQTVLDLGVNETYKIETPDNIEAGVWDSNNKDVATVNNGNIITKSEGTAVITLSDNNVSTASSVVVYVQKKPQISSISIVEGNSSIIIGNEKQLTLTVQPAEATQANIEWQSSDTSVAIVNNGLVKALKKGTTIIKAISNNIESSVVVNVVEVEVALQTVNLNTKDLNISTGDIIKIDYTISPNNATYNKIKWESSDSSIAMISDGKIQALKEGKAVITINIDGKKSSCNINVSKKNIILDTDKITVETDNIIQFQTNENKEVYPVIDLLVAVNSSIKGDNTKIDQSIRDLKNLGFTKVYFVLIPEGTPSLGFSLIKPVPDGYSYQYWESAMSNTNNNINKAYLDSCHKYGMEAVAIYKPYEGGGGTSYPSSKETAYAAYLTNKAVTTTIGGNRTYFTGFLSSNLNLRLKRKYNENENKNSKLAINKVTMSFFNDLVDLSKINLNDLNTLDANKPRVWISSDNGEYFVYTNFTYKYTYTNNYLIYDENGFSTNNYKPIITLTININELDQNYRYIAVTFHSTHVFQKNQTEAMNGYVTFPNSMIKLYNNDTLIPSTTAYYVRKPINQSDKVENHIWGNETTPVSAVNTKGFDNIQFANGEGKVDTMSSTYKLENNGADQFYKWGFEFQYKTSNVSVTNGINSGVYAIAAGKDEYIQGLLCEGYESVRNYWLSEVKSILNMGYDGIDIRTTSHSANIIDYAYYGYNEPIEAAYFKKYNVNLNSEPVNYVVTRRISEIRGEYFLKFLEAASSLTHSYKKTFISDLYATSYETYNSQDVTTYRLKEGLNEFYYWFNSKMIVQDWKKIINISDEIVFKDIFLPDYSTSNQKIGKAIINYAHSIGKPVTIHCYTGQGNNNCPSSFFKQVGSTSIDSILVYELINYDSSYQSVLNNLKQISKVANKYTISSDKITGIYPNTKVKDFVKNLNMLGSFIVIDQNNNSLSKDSVIQSNMKLIYNNKYYYTLIVN